jgi:hypothetical protein
MSNCGASALRSLSGEWLYTIGLPGKSGIGGGIVMVSPGKGGLGTFAPQLDAAGNSVKGQLAALSFALTRPGSVRVRPLDEVLRQGRQPALALAAEPAHPTPPDVLAARLLTYQPSFCRGGLPLHRPEAVRLSPTVRSPLWPAAKPALRTPTRSQNAMCHTDP